MIKKSMSICGLVLLFCYTLWAAESGQNLWITGKIHVVLGVLTIIFTGIVIFLLALERKISKLEKRFGEKTAN